MERPIGYWLKLVDRLIDERFDATLLELGATRRQWQVLNVLKHGPATRGTVDEAVAPFLPAATGSSPAGTAASAVDTLLQSGWVSESSGILSTTPAGTAEFSHLFEAVSTMRASLANGIEASDYELTTRTLERMAVNLGWDSTA